MDIEVESNLEEGEIEDSDSDDIYKPLERPQNLTVPRQLPLDKSSEDERDTPVSSDSSDSERRKQNNTKRSKPMSKAKRNVLMRKKYDIWCAHAEEEVLAETLISCDVGHIDRSRSVESYQYPVPNSDRNNKRKFGERNSVHKRVGRRELSDEDAPDKEERILLSLDSNENTEDDVLAQDLANKLLEQKYDIIGRFIKIAGKQKAIKLFEEVRRIEKEGGMLIMNKTRRRTPGGVYFFLIKHDEELTQEQKDEIFGEDRELLKKQRRERDKMRRKQKAAMANKNKKERKDSTSLPELLTRAEQCVQDLVQSGERTRKDKPEDGSENVTNPPPSPVTDCRENSSDCPEPSSGAEDTTKAIAPQEKSYEEDYLDLTCGADMDMDLY